MSAPSPESSPKCSSFVQPPCRNGDAARALDLLEQACANGGGRRDWVEHHRDLDPLRDQPRFRDLLLRMRNDDGV